MGYSLWDCKESDTTEQLTLTYNKLHMFKMCTLMSFDTSVYTCETITMVKKITYLGTRLPTQRAWVRSLVSLTGSTTCPLAYLSGFLTGLLLLPGPSGRSQTSSLTAPVPLVLRHASHLRACALILLPGNKAECCRDEPSCHEDLM